MVVIVVVVWWWCLVVGTTGAAGVALNRAVSHGVPSRVVPGYRWRSTPGMGRPAGSVENGLVVVVWWWWSGGRHNLGTRETLTSLPHRADSHGVPSRVVPGYRWRSTPWMGRPAGSVENRLEMGSPYGLGKVLGAPGKVLLGFFLWERGWVSFFLDRVLNLALPPQNVFLEALCLW